MKYIYTYNLFESFKNIEQMLIKNDNTNLLDFLNDCKNIYNLKQSEVLTYFFKLLLDEDNYNYFITLDKNIFIEMLKELTDNKLLLKKIDYFNLYDLKEIYNLFIKENNQSNHIKKILFKLVSNNIRQEFNNLNKNEQQKLLNLFDNFIDNYETLTNQSIHSYHVIYTLDLRTSLKQLKENIINFLNENHLIFLNKYKSKLKIVYEDDECVLIDLMQIDYNIYKKLNGFANWCITDENSFEENNIESYLLIFKNEQIFNLNGYINTNCKFFIEIKEDENSQNNIFITSMNQNVSLLKNLNDYHIINQNEDLKKYLNNLI